MIIHLKENTEQSVAEKIAGELEAIVLNEDNRIVLITPSTLKKLDEKYSNNVEEYFSSNFFNVDGVINTIRLSSFNTIASNSPAIFSATDCSVFSFKCIIIDRKSTR